MKKTSTRYKVSLLVGLLGLNILSACVNTRKDLGIDSLPSKTSNLNCMKSPQSFWKKSNLCTKFLLGGTILGSFITGFYFMLSSDNQSTTNQPNAINPGIDKTNLTTSLPSVESVTSSTDNVVLDHGPVWNMPTETQDEIMRSIERNNTKYDDEIETTTQDPDHVVDPMVLTDEIIEAIKLSNCSKGTIDHYLNNGLDVNAVTSENKTTLLHYAADLENLEGVQYLIEKKANPCLKDKSGSSPRRYIVFYDKKKFDTDAHFRTVYNISKVLKEAQKAQNVIKDIKCQTKQRKNGPCKVVSIVRNPLQLAKQ